ncbi:MAG: type II toxin-antitoxin system VapC family toxin [Thermodesulfobacteriota bacterium]
MMHEVFLDTSYAIALSSEKDRFHNKALELADQIEADKSVLITTRPVLLEIGNALSGPRFRKSAVLLLDSLENDPNVGIVSLTDALYQQGVQFFRKRMDKEWGLVDCISFVVMSERNIFVALTTDDHFRQAGFRANTVHLGGVL